MSKIKVLLTKVDSDFAKLCRQVYPHQSYRKVTKGLIPILQEIHEKNKKRQH